MLLSKFPYIRFVFGNNSIDYIHTLAYIILYWRLNLSLSRIAEEKNHTRMSESEKNRRRHHFTPYFFHIHFLSKRTETKKKLHWNKEQFYHTHTQNKLWNIIQPNIFILIAIMNVINDLNSNKKSQKHHTQNKLTNA